MTDGGADSCPLCGGDYYRDCVADESGVETFASCVRCGAAFDHPTDVDRRERVSAALREASSSLLLAEIARRLEDN